jgi:nitroreductase
MKQAAALPMAEQRRQPVERNWRWRALLPKSLKVYGRHRLLHLCQALNATSLWIQRRWLKTTIERERAETNLHIGLSNMDQDLLGMYIRWNGHHVEKTVRYERTMGRGSGKPVLLRRALDEWKRRGYPNRRWIDWAEANLEDHKKWEETGVPQLHPAKLAPVFSPDSPILEVLKNRVSTRYWKEMPVEDEKIEAVLEAAVYAPTSCNRQTWKLYVQKNKHIASINDVSNRALRQKAPVAVYITIDNRLYPEVWAPAEDAGIIGLQLNLAATALGFAGCLMYGAETFNQEEFRKQYNVPEYRFMYLMFLFGYAGERTLPDKRIHADEIAIYI